VLQWTPSRLAFGYHLLCSLTCEGVNVEKFGQSGGNLLFVDVFGSVLGFVCVFLVPALLSTEGQRFSVTEIDRSKSR